MSVGARLRRARLDASLPLDQISDITKIPLWILHSIERDEFSQVPGGIFVRGYLSSFARAVGLDANEILTAHFGPPPEPAAAAAPDEVRRPGYTGTPLWQVAALIALIAATAVVWRDAWKRNADVVATAPAPTDVDAPTQPAIPASPALPALSPSIAPPIETPAPVVAPQELVPTPVKGPVVTASKQDERPVAQQDEPQVEQPPIDSDPPAEALGDPINTQ